MKLNKFNIASLLTKKKIEKVKKWIYKHKYLVIVFVIFAFDVFLRFYQIELKTPFGYDQVDNAWAAKAIIADHKFPLVGMVAKGNSGIYIGPAYYYLVSFFYFLTNLHPVASGIFAGLTSIFSFWVIYFVSKKLFSVEVAIIAIFINTFTIASIFFDRVQWPVNFIPSISLLIFYCLYKITQGEVKKIIPLALLIGFFFNIHFTAIFFPLIVIFALPFFPRTRETLKYILISIPLFFVWLIPNIIYQINQKSTNTFTSYLNNNYHGLHLTRMIQILGDGLIQFNPYLVNDILANLKFVALPLFFVNYLYKPIFREKLIFCYLILLWYIIPWVVFSTYSGEISDYYFSISRYISLMIISYLIMRILKLKNITLRIIVIVILIYIAITNVINYLPYKDESFIKKQEQVRQAVSSSQRIEYTQGAPESYLYYFYMRQKGKNVY